MHQPNQIIRTAAFNHCPTICEHYPGVMLAWYAGTRECHDDQRVHLVCMYGTYHSESIELEFETGNPVLWHDGNRILILYSKFERRCFNPITRWEYCSLWIREVQYAWESHTWTVSEPTLVAEHTQHLLGRCHPLRHPICNGVWIIPLYDESNRCGVMYAWNGTVAAEIGRCRWKQDIIQPTIWYDSGILHALFRSMSYVYPYAAYAKSYNHGHTWIRERPVHRIQNCNNSLHSTTDIHGRTWLLWNASISSRENMSLGILQYVDNRLYMTPVMVIQPGRSAYPTICGDRNGSLHMAYSDKSGIAYHTWHPTHPEWDIPEPYNNQ